MIFNVLGGHDGRQSLRSTELITINPPSTRYGPTLPKGLYSHCSVIIRDKIFVIGGRNSNGHGFKETLMIDVATREITNGPDMHFARKYHACTSYMNEKGENGERGGLRRGIVVKRRSLANLSKRYSEPPDSMAMVSEH